MRLLVLDGNSIASRAFYGIKLLTTKEGVYTNAIYGFLNILNKLMDETNPQAVAIAFDLKAKTFRHEAYDAYKANRKGMPEELASQMPVLKDLLKKLGYSILECEGFEADDILGTLAKSCDDTENECIIATGDKDSLQLVTKNVSVRIAATRFGKPDVTLYDEAKIKEVYNLKPEQLIEIKALQGDPSDNIPGVKGIGEKTALILIQKYDSIDNIYQNIDNLDIRPSLKQKLIGGKNSAFMSRTLGTIRQDVPIETEFEKYITVEAEKQEVFKILKKLEMFSIIDKMNLNDLNIKDNTEKGIKKAFDIKIQIENNLDSFKEKLINNKENYFLAEFDRDENIKRILFYIDDTIYIVNSSDDINELLKYIFNNINIEFRTHNLKPFLKVLQKLGIDAKNINFDIMLAAYLLSPDLKKYDLTKLYQIFDIGRINNKNLSQAEEDIYLLPEATEKLQKLISQNEQDYLLKEVEIPLSKVLAEMENTGFKIDPMGIKNYGKVLKREIDFLQNKIYDLIGYEFNLNSPKQLGVALFEKLGLKTGKKTKTGYSTNVEVLESLKYQHPAVEMLLKYRTVSKLKSTYCDGLVKMVAEDGRIHSNLNQTETRTGRISSTKPNLQNIPVKTEIGKELRKFFIAKDGYVLVDADYSQIELRVLAHISNDENMIDAFKKNLDIHTITASQVFNIPEEMVTPLMRNMAKAVNFGIVYGIGAFSLSKDIGVSVKEAQRYINEYMHHYRGIAAYMKSVVESAKKTSYAKTMFGRRRYLRELTSSNHNLRSFGERVAMNMPIQGTAADIIKIAMVRVEQRLKKENMKAKLIMQVHDELIVEAPENEASKAADILKEEMENSAHLNVPLLALASIGKTWYEAKS